MRYIYVIFVTLLLQTVLHAEATVISLVPHYLYQFANHIKKEHTDSIYHIHIISKNTKFKKEFEKVLLKQKVRSKRFVISQGSTLNIPKDTDMLYFPSQKGISFTHLSDLVEGRGILLVSFNESDKKRVMINLFMSKKNRLSFEINRANILNEGFSISDKVVLMGGTELDVAKLFKGAKKSLVKKELELQKSQKKLDVIVKKTALLREKNTHKTAQLKKMQQEMKKLSKSIKSMSKSLSQERKKLLTEKELFKLQEKQNKKLQNELVTNNSMYESMKINLQQMSQKIEHKNKFIKEREQALDDVNMKIIEKEKALNKLSRVNITQNKQIKTQENTIDAQENILMSVVMALALFVLMLFVIVLMYQTQRQVSKKLEITLNELQETQEELIQSAKMASLGELVSGLAHEMNTPIGVSITGMSIVQNTSQELQKKLQDKRLKESDLLTFLTTIDKLSSSVNISLQKAAQLVRSFKQVSVDQEVEVLREFNLNEYISTILLSLQGRFKHSSINIDVKIDKDIKLNSYPGIYYQILTNLINNSLLHAFEESKEGHIFIEANIEKSKLYLTYKDDGKGVSEENISHIFEPFFTTKRANGGTGLGLHIIYNLITQKLRGSIKAQSIEGKGLSIFMSFPINSSTQI